MIHARRLPVLAGFLLFATGLLGQSLLGRVALPTGEGPWPVVLIIAGSGPTDGNGNSPLMPGENNSLKMLAEGLAGAGYASVRIDKRGIGLSAAALDSARAARWVFDDYVADAVAWLERLGQDPRFGPRIVLGHSEGALIGLLAAQKAGASAYVSLAGPAQSADTLILQQLGRQLPDSLMAGAEAIFGSLRQGELVPDPPRSLRRIFAPSGQPYLMNWLRYSPWQLAQQSRFPMLFVQGSSDLQVGMDQLEIFEKALPGAQFLRVEGMNHVLKDAPVDKYSANLATYSNPALPLSAGLVEGIVLFLRQHDL